MSDVNMKSDDCKENDEGIEDQDDKSSKHSVPSPTDSCSSKDSQNDNLDTSDCNVKNEDSVKRQVKSYLWHRRRVSSDPDVKKSSSSSLSDRNNFFLKISNFPSSWSFGQIKDFILKEYGPVVNLYMAADKDMCFVGMVKLEFVTLPECRRAWEKLHGKVVEDMTLFADTGDSDDDDFINEMDSSPPKKKRRNVDTIWRPDEDVWETDPKGLYGFKPAFLKSLEINPPIDKWVQVTNFRCDKSELKEVMELAGEVLICKVDTRVQRIAKVMYSHPIEAVQAVSMLNNQEFYGQVLKVTIDRCPVGTVFLPKGLQAIGPGLGKAGKALRDIVKQYERFVRNHTSFVNPTIFSNPDLLFTSNEDDSKIYVPKRLDELHSSTANQNNYEFQSNYDENTFNFLEPTPPGTNSSFKPNPGPIGYSGSRPIRPISAPVRPLAASGPMSMSGQSGHMPGPHGLIACPVLPGHGPISCPVRQMPGPIGSIESISPRIHTALPSTVGPMAHSSGPMPGPRPMPGFNGGITVMPLQMTLNVPINPRPQDTASVELSNLPLTTTFPLLCEKMAQCGQVISLQLTSPGCAVVQFAQRMHAERCFRVVKGDYGSKLVQETDISVFVFWPPYCDCQPACQAWRLW